MEKNLMKYMVTMNDTKNILATWAQRGAASGIDCGKMCNDCAFKAGSDANNDDAATESALQSLQWDGHFNCHTSNFENAGVSCAGFLYAKHYVLSDQFLKDLRNGLRR